MRILLVSPFPAERLALEDLLSGEGHHVRSVASRAEALLALATERPDVVVADAQVPGADGLSLVRALSDRGASRVILLCPRANRVIKRVGVVCLKKPIDLDELRWHLAQHPIQIALP